MLPQIISLTTSTWKDYELIDSGYGRKLERFGNYTFIRPEHQAIWKTRLPIDRWQDPHAVFEAMGNDEQGGKWRVNSPITSWIMQYKNLKFKAQLGGSRHVGVFPEQAAHWDWISEIIKSANRPVSVLNLFGYTGLATLAAAQAGAKVTHVDASKKSVTWARENQALSNIADQKIRWIVDDAMKFVQREGRRDARYDGIILDPPKFGRGPKGEVWECFEMLPKLLESCKSILSPQPLFIVITAYAIRASSLSLFYSLRETISSRGGTVEAGELVVTEHGERVNLSMAIFARWKSG